MNWLLTALLYLSLFTCVFALLRLAERLERGRMRYALLFAAALLPACLAGFRDVSVGTDFSMYRECLDTYVQTKTWSLKSLRFEAAFKLVVSSLGPLCPTPECFFTSLYLAMYLTVICAFYRLRGKVPFAFACTAYFVLCMIPGWNALRSFLSASLFALALSFLLTGCTIRSVAFFAATVVFQQTSVMYWLPLPLLVLPRRMRMAYLGVLTLSILVGFRVIATQFGLQWYVQEVPVRQHIILKYFLCYLPFVYILWRHVSVVADDVIKVGPYRRSYRGLFAEIIALLLILQLFGFYMNWADRLLWPFFPFVGILCAYLLRRGDVLAKIWVFFYLIPYTFFYNYMVCGQNECNVYLIGP